jgi:hypothetical protein
LGVGVEANGKILQLINNLPAWSDIDCGTFWLYLIKANKSI